MASDSGYCAFQAEVRFAETAQWVAVGVEESRLAAEAALAALVRSWIRMGRPPLDARVVQILAPAKAA